MFASASIVLYAVIVMLIRSACRHFLSKPNQWENQPISENGIDKQNIIERITSFPNIFDAEPLINYDDPWGKEITESSLKRAHHMLETASKRLDEEALTASDEEDSDESPVPFEFKAPRRNRNQSPHGSIIPNDSIMPSSNLLVVSGSTLAPFIPPSPSTPSDADVRCYEVRSDDLKQSPTSIPAPNSQLSSPAINKTEVEASFPRAPKRRINSVLSGYLGYRTKPSNAVGA